MRISLSLLCATALTVTSLLAQSGSHVSLVPLKPEARAALKAKGKSLRNPFPNSVNQGRKFNPVGDLVPALVTANSQRVLVIFIDFTTTPPGGPAAHVPISYFDEMLFGNVYDPPEYAPYAGHPTDRTLKNYYSFNSYGAVDVVTLNLPSALGWAHSVHPYDYYCKADGIHDNGFGPFPQNAAGLVLEAVQAIDSIVDFSEYAINGEVPNIFVVHSGTGAEWSGDPGIIWSHSWSLSGATGHAYTADGVIVDQYAMMPEVGGDLTGYTGAVSGPFPPTVGVYAHEFAHVLGVPDQYDYGYESEGTGLFSLMAAGSWNGYPGDAMFSGNSPSNLDAWSKYRLGFVNPTVISDTAHITLHAAGSFPEIYKMVVPFSGGKEYYLLENRQPVNFDQGLRLGTMHGLVIYHIDDTALARSYWRPNEAENWKEFRSLGWQKAWTGESHYAISVIQADDQWHLEHGTGVGSQTDMFPGALGRTEFTSFTLPNTSTYYFWLGAAPPFGWSHVKISNIAEFGGVITADLSYEP